MIPESTRHPHYVRIDVAECNGCVRCMQACPTRAIRIRGGRTAVIEGVCIDCGECIRACPRGAVHAVTTGVDPASLKRYPIICVSPGLYAQFGDGHMPNDILLSLRRSFPFVYDLGYANEIFNAVTHLYLARQRANGDAEWPLISPGCPVVNRLIAYRFPTLLNRLLPVITPREIAAKALKTRLSEESIIDMNDVGVYLVTPCSAEMISIQSPLTIEASSLNGAMGINEVYLAIKKHIDDIDPDIMLHSSSGVGIGWGISGGEISGLEPGKYLAVSGIRETISYLEKIEMGLFADVEYVEFRGCLEGCLGGPMNAVDRYMAKQTLARMTRMFGLEKRVTPNQVRKAYDARWFASNIRGVIAELAAKRMSLEEALAREEKIESIQAQLSGKCCGACGSPDCRTFAEDVADQKAPLTDCVFVARPTA